LLRRALAQPVQSDGSIGHDAAAEDLGVAEPPHFFGVAEMGRALERLEHILRGEHDDEVFKAFLRHTVHDYRPSGENVIAISSFSKASTHR
jgi:hypothetical protein